MPKAAATAGASRVENCDVDDAATRAASLRPFAVVLTRDIYEFDRKEFDALARDVHAEIIELPEIDLGHGELVDWLNPPARERAAPPAIFAHKPLEAVELVDDLEQGADGVVVHGDEVRSLSALLGAVAGAAKEQVLFVGHGAESLGSERPLDPVIHEKQIVALRGRGSRRS